MDVNVGNRIIELLLKGADGMTTARLGLSDGRVETSDVVETTLQPLHEALGLFLTIQTNPHLIPSHVDVDVELKALIDKINMA